MAKSKKKLADEAALRNEELLSGRVPVPEGVLPGQMNLLDDSVAGVSDERTVVRSLDSHVAWPLIPDTCTKCSKSMSIESGWTPLKPEEERKIQCGACGEIIVVPRGAYDTLAMALRARFSRSDVQKFKVGSDRGKKTRGAG